MRLCALPFCARTSTRQRTSRGTYWKAVKGYPSDPKTIGEWVKKRRLDLGLEQAETATRLGVHVETVKNWEHGIFPPAVVTMPKVLEFLGTNPLRIPTTFAERLIDYRVRHGLRQDELARRLGVNPSTIRRWETGKEPRGAKKRLVDAIFTTDV